MASGELACTYAALILSDDGIAITAEKIATIVKAANIKVESYWPALFAKLLEKRNVEDLILSVGSGTPPLALKILLYVHARGLEYVDCCVVVVLLQLLLLPLLVVLRAAAAPAAEEKKEEVKEESDDDMGFSLFD
ncbi:unnamed protein product [Miscanthus lutarioriparius]|uniref:60S acidic ribosomal protein P1 n=1 Tax=Miscanthus lutarioriparius TaxID=422564 RepID=A0A811R8N6_9POAL|nr:unnamed protein product [Miscanthus lutarioriparius]